VGFAHGFLTLSDHAEVLYKATDFWDRGSERAIRWDDPTLAVAWPFSDVQVSAKDEVAPTLATLVTAELFPDLSTITPCAMPA
jgi:dTDP-4-dehydrorhamnose 3,5-epimerase